MSSNGNDTPRPDYYRTVIRAKEDYEIASSQVVNDDDSGTELPLGIRLHGGDKLRVNGLTGKGIKVGVIDSGINKTHPLFHGSVTGGYDYQTGRDIKGGHGTHVAGTIHMMAPDAELRDYRVFGEIKEDYTSKEAICQAIIDAHEDGCDILNLSLASRRPDDSILSAIALVQSRGVIVVAAASNYGDGDILTNERGYPACFEETISVAAVQKRHNLPVARISSSNAGVDYAGIGQNVRSFNHYTNGYMAMTGTSMACPHIAGLIAALISGSNADNFKRERGRDAKVRELLKNYTFDIGVEGRDNSTGLGFVTYLTKLEFDGMFTNSGGSDYRVMGVSKQSRDPLTLKTNEETIWV